MCTTHGERRLIIVLCQKNVGKQIDTCVKRLFWPPIRLKNKNCFSPISSHQFIRTIALMLTSGIDLTFTATMGTKMAAKIG